MSRQSIAKSALLACGLMLAAQGALSAGQSAKAWRDEQLAAADRAEGIMATANRRSTPLQQYQVMLNAATAARADDRAFKLIFNQYLSWYQTFIGDYPDAALSFSIGEPAQPGDRSAPLHGYTPTPAIDAIAQLARGRRAVFLNEAHHLAQTRSLTVPLLARLRREGFNTFAVETLYASDTGLARRGYPIPASGFYTREPVYAEMVRTALRLGYTVMAYEAEDSARGEARERDQARKLSRLLRDPKTRLVVNAGYAHIRESGSYLGGKSMAQFVHQLSGIDPLTVEQTTLMAHPDPAMDHPDYAAMRQTPGLVFDRSLVFLDAHGAPWSLREGYDVSVFFPPAHLHQGRPDWLTLGGLRHATFVSGDNLCQRHFPCLIEARYVDEGDDAIAADLMLLDPPPDPAQPLQRMEMTPGHRDGDLYLRPGRYRLRATDADGHGLGSRVIEVSAPEPNHEKKR